MARTDGYRSLAAALLASAASASLVLSAPASAAEQARRDETVRFAAPPLDRFDAISQRPLFSPSRRPPQAAPEQAPARKTPPPEIALTGVTMVGARRKAIIQIAGGSRIVAVGERIGEWRVAAIEDLRLTIERGAQRHAYELTKEPQARERRPRDAGGASAGRGARSEGGALVDRHDEFD